MTTDILIAETMKKVNDAIETVCRYHNRLGCTGQQPETTSLDDDRIRVRFWLTQRYSIVIDFMWSDGGGRIAPRWRSGGLIQPDLETIRQVITGERDTATC